MSKIYVGIPSMCDPLLPYTIYGCFSNADQPQNIRMCIIEQEYPEDALDWTDPKIAQYKKYIDYNLYNPADSRGCSWARALAQKEYDGEQFYLQIDSHTGFEKGWDTTYIKSIVELQEYHDKPIISCYPEGMTARDDDPISNPVPETWEPIENENTICRTVGAGDVKKNSKGDLIYPGLVHVEFMEEPDNYIYYYGSDHYYNTPQPYTHGFGFSGGGTFTLGSFITEVPWDLDTYFSGEEQVNVLRAWTRGWNVFHRKGGYPIRHYYAPLYKAEKNHWSDAHNLKTPWTQQADIGKDRQRDIYRGKVTGKMGLGTTRTLAQYAAWCGVDIENKILKPKSFSLNNPLFKLDWKKDPKELYDA